MILKEADDLEPLLAYYEQQHRASRDDGERKKIELRLKKLKLGILGEKQVAYEMALRLKNSKNHIVIHDLRVVCHGDVAQIDHVIINRMLEVWVCESKNFQGGLSVNERGEFVTFFNKTPKAVASPIEQNKKHMMILENLLKTSLLHDVPSRLGVKLKPSLRSLIILGTGSRFTHPKNKDGCYDNIIKSDQIFTYFDNEDKKEVTFIEAVRGMASIISQDTLLKFAQALVRQHQPDPRLVKALEGQSPACLPNDKTCQPNTKVTTEVAKEEKNIISADLLPKSKNETRRSNYCCAACGITVESKVAKYCWFNKPKFAGKIYCRGCQQLYVQSGVI